MARWLAHAMAVALPVATLLAACDRGPKPPAKETGGAETHAADVARPKIPLAAPGDDSIPAGPEGDLIRRGRVIATRTSEELPAVVGSDLHCTSCHLEGATKAYAGPWVGVTSVYPMYRSRAGREITIEDRIDECFDRSMNGHAPPQSSPETKALVAYMTWLSKDVPRGTEVIGRGFKKLEPPPNVDPAAGAVSYQARCASCHGQDGQGKRGEGGVYQYPPLWGDRSFNVGAGMARLDTAASFVRHNMPLGSPEPLTVAETYDIAAYFTREGRPDFAGKAKDWPRGGKPRDARY